jgi:hypothetical protein
MTYVPNTNIPRTMTDEDKDDGYYQFAVIPKEGDQMSVTLYRKNVSVDVSNGYAGPVAAVDLTYDQVRALHEALANIMNLHDAV